MKTTSRRCIALAPAIALALYGLAGAALADDLAVEDTQPVETPELDGPSPSRAPAPASGDVAAEDTQPVETPVLDGPPPSRAPSPANTRDQRQPTVVEFHALEDQPVALELPSEFDGMSIVEPPQHGTLLADHKPMQYIPHPDFNGMDVISFGTGNSKPMASVAIKVAEVNDPPRFESMAGRAHAAGDVGAQLLPRWAKAIEAGPGDEAWSQQVWFDATESDDPSGVVESLSVSPDGTLSYVLSGQPGIATWTVRALDNGGNLHGGISVSDAHQVRIAVDAVADLSIKMVPVDFAPGLRLLRSYQLVVSNIGKSDAFGARVVDVLPKDAGDPTWRCVGSDGGACPKVETGSGALDATVDLPAGSLVVFTVERVASPAGDPSHVAYVVPPDYLIDPDLSNNEAGE